MDTAPGRGAEASEPNAARMDAAEIAKIVARLLADLPPRRKEPATVPPLRRPQLRARLGLGPQQS